MVLLICAFDCGFNVCWLECGVIIVITLLWVCCMATLLVGGFVGYGFITYLFWWWVDCFDLIILYFVLVLWVCVCALWYLFEFCCLVGCLLVLLL